VVAELLRERQDVLDGLVHRDRRQLGVLGHVAAPRLVEEQRRDAGQLGGVELVEQPARTASATSRSTSL
jgi:hypothetical protein